MLKRSGGLSRESPISANARAYYGRFEAFFATFQRKFDRKTPFFRPLQGDIKDGLPEGRGIIRWADGSWYEGEFRDGLRNGRGLHVSSEDGRRWYSGPWTGGLREGPEGQTSCESDNAMDYVGHWVDGRPHGHGTATWPDGTRYAGQWADGKPHGHGKIVWPDNDVSEVFRNRLN